MSSHRPPWAPAGGGGAFPRWRSCRVKGKLFCFVFFYSHRRGALERWNRWRLLSKWLGALVCERVSRVFSGSFSGRDKGTPPPTLPLLPPPPPLTGPLYHCSQISISPAGCLETPWETEKIDAGPLPRAPLRFFHLISYHFPLTWKYVSET